MSSAPRTRSTMIVAGGLQGMAALAAFVLHAFQKKSHRGIATARTDIDILHARVRVARRLDRELASGETRH